MTLRKLAILCVLMHFVWNGLEWWWELWQQPNFLQQRPGRWPGILDWPTFTRRSRNPQGWSLFQPAHTHVRTIVTRLEKIRWDSKFFKKSLKNVAETSKVSFLSLKNLLRFQKFTFVTDFRKISSGIFLNTDSWCSSGAVGAIRAQLVQFWRSWCTNFTNCINCAHRSWCSWGKVYEVGETIHNLVAKIGFWAF